MTKKTKTIRFEILDLVANYSPCQCGCGKYPHFLPSHGDYMMQRVSIDNGYCVFDWLYLPACAARRMKATAGK